MTMAWPESLIQDIARRRCVLFLGAGVSMNSLSEDGVTRPPDWSGFLNDGLSRLAPPTKHIKSLIASGDFLTACELIKKRLDEDWNSLLDSSFVKPKYRHAEIHEHILSLDSRIVLTQNFDKIYDTYAQTTTHNSIRVKSYTDPDVSDFIRGGMSVVVKAHGTIDVPAEMVFTRNEYSSARHEYRAFYPMIDALAVTHTFLFIGCGVNDPDVRLLLEKVAFFNKGSRPHYICMPRVSGAPHDEVLRSYRDNLALKSLVYDPKNGHAALTRALELLAQQVESERRSMASTLSW